MKHRSILASAIALLFAACASKEVNISTTDNTKKFDKQVNFNTADSNEKVGIRGDDVVIQKRSYLEDQLAKLRSEVDDLQSTIYGKSRMEPGGLWVDLKDCQEKLNDPRLGGNGAPMPMEKWEKVTEKEDDANYVVDKHNTIMAVSEEGVDARIVRFRKYKSQLTQKYDDMKDKVDTCQQKYKTALINHGMNPDDTKAQGEWVDGPNGYKVWRMRKPATNDPEELAKRKAQKD